MPSEFADISEDTQREIWIPPCILCDKPINAKWDAVYPMQTPPYQPFALHVECLAAEVDANADIVNLPVTTSSDFIRRAVRAFEDVKLYESENSPTLTGAQRQRLERKRRWQGKMG